MKTRFSLALIVALLGVALPIEARPPPPRGGGGRPPAGRPPAGRPPMGRPPVPGYRPPPPRYHDGFSAGEAIAVGALIGGTARLLAPPPPPPR